MIFNLVFFAFFCCSKGSTEGEFSASVTQGKKQLREDISIKSFIKNKYCFSDQYNELTLFFKQKEDTIFLYYLNIVDNGNYINGGDEEEDDPAGSFLSTSILSNTAEVKIRNYRFEDVNYKLQLTFNEHHDKIQWEISPEEQPSYLPQKANLEVCHFEKEN